MSHVLCTHMLVFGVVRELCGCEMDETTQHVRQLRVQLEDAVRLSLNLHPLILQHQLIWSSQQQVHLQYSKTLISTHTLAPAYLELPAAGIPTIQYNLNLHSYSSTSLYAAPSSRYTYNTVQPYLHSYSSTSLSGAPSSRYTYNTVKP